MINKKVETFLEKHNMNYMFCLLSNLEVQRINQLPPYIKQKFQQKLSEIALEHVADNDVPDYMMDIEEAKAEMERLGISMEDLEPGGRRDHYGDDEDYEPELEPEDFKDPFKQTYTDENYDDDFDEEETADSDEE